MGHYLKSPAKYLHPIFILAFINFAVFLVVASKIGGGADNGRVVGGRYFLGDHGRYTEVSRAVYNYSLIHGASTLITHALFFGGMFVLMSLGRLYERPSAKGIGEVQSAHINVPQVRIPHYNLPYFIGARRTPSTGGNESPIGQESTISGNDPSPTFARESAWVMPIWMYGAIGWLCSSSAVVSLLI